MGIVTLAGVAIGWVTNIPVVTERSPALAYVYFYGGFIMYAAVVFWILWPVARPSRHGHKQEIVPEE